MGVETGDCLADLHQQRGGSGHTPLSAFDHALCEAGIHNYNLLPLSSVIPPGTVLAEERYAPRPEEWGQRLYIVMARGWAMVAGTETWAGIGWVQAPDGRGLFVEHTDASRDNVVDMIKLSLQDMMAYRDETFGEIKYALQGARCVDKPVCALVAAVYASAGWR